MSEQRNFLALVSHEFRTPLAIMSVSAEIIASNLSPDDQESAGELSRIRRASMRLAGLVDSCLADEWLASTESRRSGHIDLHDMLRSLVVEHGVSSDLDSHCPMVVDGDSYLLPIAFSCLLDNARKYGRTKDAVLVRRAACAADAVAIEVVDDGPGIEADEVSRIFEKFYRSPKVGRMPGSGLGLYLVKKIIELHGGSVEYEKIQGGSLFRVVLPTQHGAEAK